MFQLRQKYRQFSTDMRRHVSPDQSEAILFHSQIINFWTNEAFFKKNNWKLNNNKLSAFLFYQKSQSMW